MALHSQDTLISKLCQENPRQSCNHQRQHGEHRQQKEQTPRRGANLAPSSAPGLNRSHHNSQCIILGHGSPLPAYDEDLRRVVVGVDQPLSTQPLADPSKRLKKPPAVGGLPVRRGVLCVLEARQGKGNRHLKRLRFFLVPDERHQRILLFFDEGQMSADGTHNSVSDNPIAVDADQRFHQTVVAEHMSAAQGPLCARQALIAHRALPCVLLAVLLVLCHMTKCTRLDQTSIGSVGEERESRFTCAAHQFLESFFFFFCGWRRELRLVKQGLTPVDARTDSTAHPERSAGISEQINWFIFPL